MKPDLAKAMSSMPTPLLQACKLHAAYAGVINLLAPNILYMHDYITLLPMLLTACQEHYDDDPPWESFDSEETVLLECLPVLDSDFKLSQKLIVTMISLREAGPTTSCTNLFIHLHT